MRSPRALLAWLTLATVLGGCSHYRLGTGSAPPFRSLHVAPADSRIALPQGAALLSARLRDSLLRDTRVELRPDPATAEAALTLTLVDYRREIAAARADDTGLARKFNVSLTAVCTLRDPRTGRSLWAERRISVRREVFTDRGQLQAEYQTLALLTDALAARIASDLLEMW
ncbi:MAG: LPS assembly lipoprotein LptE [Opitutaceae bacterium]